MQIIDIGYLFVVVYGENVDVVSRGCYDLTLLLMGRDEVVAALHYFCLFKPHLPCQSLHLCHHLAPQ